MATIRELEAELKRDVEHAILQDLGYAEFDLTLPSGVVLTPRPQVKQVDPATYSGNKIFENLINPNDQSRPSFLWEVEIPRTTSEAEITRYGNWLLTFDGSLEPPIEVELIHFVMLAASWKVFLGVVRGS